MPQLQSINAPSHSAIGVGEECERRSGRNAVSIAMPVAIQPAGIDILPVEILCLIFEHSVRRMTGRHGFPPPVGEFSTTNAPLNIIEVCSHWRAVALGTPALWNSICPTKCPLPDIRRWIAIAPKLRYHLTLSYCDHGELFDLFATTPNRWKTISLQLGPELAEQFLSLLRHDGNLSFEGLYLYFKDGVSEAVVAEIFTLLAALPSLDCFRFQSSRSCPRPTKLPLAQLKIISIYLWTFSLQEISSYLLQCSSVTQAKFGATEFVDKFPFGQVGGFALITLPNLTSLTLARGVDPILLLQHLDLPNLRYLSIEIRHRNPSVLDNLLSNTPHLQTLVIDEPIKKSWPHDPAPASDDDILVHLISPSLRRIPRVEITFRHAYKRAIEIINSYAGLSSNLYPLICWAGNIRAGAMHSSSGSYPFVGWGEGLAKHPELLWSYRDGELHITPLYYDKLLDKYF